MVDFFAAAQRVIALILSGSEIAIITWLVSGGIIYVLRGISFWIDSLLVNFISSIYGSFMTLLKGTMFNEEVVNQLLTNVYVFIGVIVFFRIAMLIIRYLMNPELVSDEKAGVNSLIKRVIIGMCGIIAIPLIFDKATELQAAIIEDQVIQQIIIPSDMIDATSKKVNDGGKYIGTYVFAGFINPSAKASNAIKNEYNIALEKGDLSSIDFNSGGFLGIGYTDYDYSYFYLISTFVLGYVLYLMLKYCLDIVVRFFKLLLYQLMAPIAMVEYMINGAENGVFKTWKSAVLSTYFMLFVRVLSIWFVIFVMTLMSGEYSMYSDGTLLATDDFLLRALIIIGLLAFMMDLPKIVGNIFGLDLEQESSATGMLKSIGGIAKGLGMGALAMGGAALGGAVGTIGGMQKAGMSNVLNRHRDMKDLMSQGMSKKEARKALHAQNAAALSATANAAKSAGLSTLAGMAGAAIGSTGMGKAIQSGYGSVSGSMSKDRAKAKEADREKKSEARHQEEMDYNRAQELRDFVSNQVANNPNANRADIISSVLDTRINAKLKGEDLGSLTTDIVGRIRTVSNQSGQITTQDVIQNVQRVISSKLDVKPEATTQIVNQIMGSSGTAPISQVDQVVNQVVDQVVQKSKSDITPEVTQVVNQVMGNVVSTTVSPVTQTINRQVDSSTIPENPTPMDQQINLDYNEPERLMDSDGQNRIRQENNQIDYQSIADNQFNNYQDG